MSTVDAHHHFWQTCHTDYGWLTPELEPLYRDFMPRHLKPMLRECKVDHTVLVQAAPSVDETHRLLAIACEHSFIAGVVGWALMDSTDGPRVIEQLAGEKKLVGLRPMIQDIDDVDWMLQPVVGDSLRTMQRCDLRFDALVLPKHLPNLRTLLAEHPDLPVVIDHAAKPDIASGSAWDGLAAWQRHIQTLANETNVACKLSGLVTETNAGWTPADLRPMVNMLLESFGPERLIWGSDWPVVTLRASYDEWWQAARELLSELTPAEQAMIFGDNAVRFYSLQEHVVP